MGVSRRLNRYFLATIVAMKGEFNMASVDKAAGIVPAPGYLKRVRRRVAGRPWRFLAVTPPGLENLCRQELMQLVDDVTDVTVMAGGVAFVGRLHHGCLANLHLRTATRVLMRIAEFTATNFRQLEKKCTAVDWQLFLPSDTVIEVRATCRHSRLYHSTAVKQRVQRAVAAGLGRTGPAGSVAGRRQQVLVRVIDDRVSLSLDTSGEPLFKRGLKTQGGRAPLRETTAAAILMLAGYRPQMPLVDPMCGSGTFSMEGACMVQHIPPGRFRTFACMRWPGFAPGRWRAVLRQADRCRQDVTHPLIFASDRDPHACRALEQVVRAHDCLRPVQVRCRDFFDFTPDELNTPKGLVVLNPPYGRRLDTPQKSRIRIDDIFRKLRTDYRGWKLAMLVPKGYRKQEAGFRVRTDRLVHGGLSVELVTGRIPE